MTKDGREFYAEIGLSPIQVGQGLWVIAVVRDISARKKEEALNARAHLDLTTINQTNAAIMQSVTEKQLLSLVCEIIVKTNQRRFAWIGLADMNPEKSIQLAGQYGYEKKYWEDLVFS